MNAEKLFSKEPIIKKIPSKGSPFMSVKDNRNLAIKQCQLKSVMQKNGIYRKIESFPQKTIQCDVVEFSAKNDAKNEFGKSFVREDHFELINDRSRDNILSIRETGAESLRRLGENANPKPHSILDKSIKKSRMEGPENENTLLLSGMQVADIEGFVGCWEKSGKLKGLMVRPNTSEAKIEPIIETEEGKSYIALSKLGELKALPDWQSYLYTGDYDLHEVYDANGNLIPEGNEKAILLNKLNGLDDNPITANGHGILENVPENAFFQHGDQATYRESAHNEANEKTGKDVAVLVPSVAVEETGRLAWFNRAAKWYISSSPKDHKTVRERISFENHQNLNPPESWEEDAAFNPADISSFGVTKTKPYIAPYSGYKSGKGNEMFKFSYEFADDFQVDPEILSNITNKHRSHISAEDAKTKTEIAKVKAINLIISNYRGLPQESPRKTKMHFTWVNEKITYYYNQAKQYCVEVEDKKIKKFCKRIIEVPEGATSI